MTSAFATRTRSVGQLYNGADAPPFAAGLDSGVNHPGVISGLHSQALDGAGYNQWVVDDATGQLRMRLAASYTAAQVGLGHLIEQAPSSAQRGAWRGAGFEASTQGWATLRAAQGLLVWQDTALVAQGDLHQAAAHTYAQVSGRTSSLFTHEGGVKAFAANGPVSLRAHTDALQLWADKAVTVISVNDEIRISAQSRIELIGGQSSMVLEGGNVTFTCPGKFEVKAAGHAFLGGGSQAAQIVRLPNSTVQLFDESFALRDPAGEPLAALPFQVTASDGIAKGFVQSDGFATRLGTRTAEPLRFELLWHELHV